MNNSDYQIKSLAPEDLFDLGELFEYHDINDMIRENSRLIKKGEIDIFALYCAEELLGELHVKYRSLDEREAADGRRAYLYAFRIKEGFRGKGFGRYLLRGVINRLKAKGYSEFTIGVEDDNAIAISLYKRLGFTDMIERRQEEYQGDDYEYDLLLRRDRPCRDFIFIIGASGIGKSTLSKKLYNYYESSMFEQSHAPEFMGFDRFEGINGIAEEEICWRWTVDTLLCYHRLGLKNIIVCDFDDLRTRDIPEEFKGYDYITLKLVCSDYEQNVKQMTEREEGLKDLELLKKLSEKINSRPALVNEFVIDVAGKTPEMVLTEAVLLIDGAETKKKYEYEKPDRELFYSWVKANGLR